MSYSLAKKSHRVVTGRYYGTPKEVWGFQTAPSKSTDVETARQVLDANAPMLGIADPSTRLKVARRIESLGSTHVILQQRHQSKRIHRAYVTVHMDRDRRVYLIKNRAVPADFLPAAAKWKVTEKQARALALRALSGRKGRLVVEKKSEAIWVPKTKRLRPTYKFRVHRSKPREEWIIYIDAETGSVVSRYDNIARVRGQARVFNPNPVTALDDWRELLSEAGNPVHPPESTYRDVALFGLKGNGFLDGSRVSTKLTKKRIRSKDHRFVMRSHEKGFEEVSAYHHVDEAVRYLQRLGYSGSRAIFAAPLLVDARGTRDDNSWYSPSDRSLTFGIGGVDDAEDGETVLHEFGHALQDAICPDFGQSPQAAAMGEGFGDYFAASFFAEQKSETYRLTVMSWDAITEPGDPAGLRRLDQQHTFESFDHSKNADEHENGEIWSATLWEIWRALGRDVADPIIIESHFQLDGFTTFARGARAILDADRNLFDGKNRAGLLRVFRRRGVGPVE